MFDAQSYLTLQPLSLSGRGAGLGPRAWWAAGVLPIGSRNVMSEAPGGGGLGASAH